MKVLSFVISVEKNYNSIWYPSFLQLNFIKDELDNADIPFVLVGPYFFYYQILNVNYGLNFAAGCLGPGLFIFLLDCKASNSIQNHGWSLDLSFRHMYYQKCLQWK